MKKLISLAVALIIGTSLFAGSLKPADKPKDGAEQIGMQFFTGTWAEALELAKSEKKMIFLDAYASWCGPCKLMSANTFTDEKVGAYFNENFINYKMDMEKHADGPRLSTKFGLRAYPTLYFISHEEAIVHSGLGYHDAGQFIALGQAAMQKK